MKYFEVRIRVDVTDNNFILNKIINRIHGMIRQHKLNIGFSFPQYNEDNSLGNIFRVFGNLENLECVVNNEGLAGFILEE